MGKSKAKAGENPSRKPADAQPHATPGRLIELIDNAFGHDNEFISASQMADIYCLSPSTKDNGRCQEYTDKTLAARQLVQADRAAIIECGKKLADTLHPPLLADVLEIVYRFETGPISCVPAKLLELWPRVRAALEALNWSPDVPPLTDPQRIAFDYIKKNPGKAGKEIVKELVIDSESVFTTHYVPALKQHGIKNRRGFGYYHADTLPPG